MKALVLLLALASLAFANTTLTLTDFGAKPDTNHDTILESDLIHGRRADGSDIDWMLHVNPHSDEKAFLSIYNPTEQELTKVIHVPLYYAGLSGSAQLSLNGRDFSKVELDAAQRCRIEVTLPAHSYYYAIWK